MWITATRAIDGGREIINLASVTRMFSNPNAWRDPRNPKPENPETVLVFSDGTRGSFKEPIEHFEQFLRIWRDKQ